MKYNTIIQSCTISLPLVNIHVFYIKVTIIHIANGKLKLTHIQ